MAQQMLQRQMIVRVVFQLYPNFGRSAQMKGFMVLTQALWEKDVAAREYCIFGNQIFKYKGKAFLEEIVEFLRQWAELGN
eukprot:12692431-Ditylum_brightwellii.AAC.1